MTTAVQITEQQAAEAHPDPEQQLRMQIYLLLSGLLKSAPDMDLLILLRHIDSEQDSGSAMVNAWAELKLAADMAEPGDVEDEYHQLFIGLGRGELVPFGSWYQTGFLMEKPLAKLRADLAYLGYERDESVHEPEDHVAALCDVMAMMIQDGAGFAQQQDFFTQHMEPWLVRFFRDLQAAEAARFYRSVGQLGESFLDIEQQYFSMMV